MTVDPNNRFLLYIAEEGGNIREMNFTNHINIVKTKLTISAIKSIVFDSTGTYIFGTSNNAIIVIHRSIWTYKKYAGSNVNSGLVDGFRLFAQFAQPTGISIDSQNNLYVADYNNNVIRYISTTTGQVSTLAGSGLFLNDLILF